ncbi:hypothetical protein KI809_19460 [Geobacter pelophilus]|uniref:Murein lipoprotein n=1 Tax=Geoanaerobacter pelophilus TaxID=60036 RepID=A0AAW4LAC6_9BACT|nr:hypothetical protein [Geoanaerobacter pelophilus]MBT0666492.1 hypothetical protein [Geoanaerobacter pelophilus]
MKRIAGFIGLMAIAGLSGCATEGFVHSQVDPLAERLGTLEKKVNALEAKPAGLSDAERMAISQADAKAQKALDAVGKLTADADRAEAAAKRAEAAAMEAKKEEKKSEKLFNLEQKK